MVELGGIVAEELYIGSSSSGVSSDLVSARNFATEMVMKLGMSEEFKRVSFSKYINNNQEYNIPNDILTKLHLEIAKIIKDCGDKTTQILTDHKKELIILVDLLLEKGTISGNEAYQACGV
jgi:cell division protease FtsH